MQLNAQQMLLLAAAVKNESACGSSVRVPVGEFGNADGEVGQFHLVATTDQHEHLEVFEQYQCIKQ